MNWKPHINEVCCKLNRFSYVLWRLVNTTDLKTTLLAYHGYVASVLRYGIAVWGNSIDMGRTFLAQKSCVRSICKIPQRTSCKPHFIRLRLLTLPSIYLYEICHFVKGNTNLFQRNCDVTNDYRGRYPNKLVLPVISSTLYDHSSYPMAVRIFNKLPDEIKQLPLPIFKNRLRNYLIDKGYYSVKEYLDE